MLSLLLLLLLLPVLFSLPWQTLCIMSPFLFLLFPPLTHTAGLEYAQRLNDGSIAVPLPPPQFCIAAPKKRSQVTDIKSTSLSAGGSRPS